MAARVRPNIMPGEVQTMIFLRPMMSIYLSATSVKTKLVPATISPTAVGLLNPIDLKRLAL